MRTGAVNRLDDPPLVLAPSERRFRDRQDAGSRLASLLVRFRDEHPIVVGIPRGGVPVAAEVARALGAPLDVVVVRKIGAPQNPEFAVGAVAERGVHVLSEETARRLGLGPAEVRLMTARVERELAERTRLLRGSGQPMDVAGRTVILVDDGLATGRSALAAIHSLRAGGAARVILAVPVAAPESVAALRGQADEIVCVEMPGDLWAVGLWYEDFGPTSDDEVIALLARGAGETREKDEPTADAGANARDGSAAPGRRIGEARELNIALPPGVTLGGDLALPDSPGGVIVFAHGSGSSRFSPRNRAVACALAEAGYATLLFDLLTPEEELDRSNVFDVELLASRLVGASTWLMQQQDLAGVPLGYFGASTGAAAALTAAAQLGERVSAVICRGGRPDLALGLASVRAPTLLIVGGADRQVLELNRAAQSRLRCPSELAVVPGATHLFEEPGALEQVTRLGIEWLDRHMAARAAGAAAGLPS